MNVKPTAESMRLHGVPASGFLYRKVLPELAARGLEGITFDLPGMGFADRPSDFDYSWSGLSKWAVKTIDAAGIDRFHLVVHDIGVASTRTPMIIPLMRITGIKGYRPPIRRPFENEVRRDVVCPNCSAKVQEEEREGRQVRISTTEVQALLVLVEKGVGIIHKA